MLIEEYKKRLVENWKGHLAGLKLIKSLIVPMKSLRNMI